MWRFSEITGMWKNAMDEMSSPDDARRKLEEAQKVRTAAEVNLRKAGIEAHARLKASGKPLTAWATEAHVSGSELSNLATHRDWRPRGRAIYEAIDRITDGDYRLAQLRDELDAAEKAINEARTVVRVADLAAEAAGGQTIQNEPNAANDLRIDDVLVDRQADRVVLDVRLRNPGTRSVNVTRVAVRILERRRFLAAYPSTADYDLLIEGDHNEVGDFSHYIKSDEVDRFHLTLGFAPSHQGILFTAEVVLRFNGDNTVVSKPIKFDSCFT